METTTPAGAATGAAAEEEREQKRRERERERIVEIQYLKELLQPQLEPPLKKNENRGGIEKIKVIEQ